MLIRGKKIQKGGSGKNGFFFTLLKFGNPRVSFVFPLWFTNTFCYLKRHTLVLNLSFLSLTEWLKQVPDHGELPGCLIKLRGLSIANHEQRNHIPHPMATFKALWKQFNSVEQSHEDTGPNLRFYAGWKHHKTCSMRRFVISWYSGISWKLLHILLSREKAEERCYPDKSLRYKSELIHKEFISVGSP